MKTSLRVAIVLLTSCCLTPALAQLSVGSEAVVLLAQGPSTSVASEAKPAAKVKSKASKTAKAASKSKSRKQADVIANELVAPKLDLSLPKEAVNQLQPATKIEAKASAKPLLPAMFDAKTSDSFELNGRLLSNEMELQMRNDARRDVEGAALEFHFKQ